MREVLRVMLLRTSSTLVVAVVELFTDGFQNGGYCVIHNRPPKSPLAAFDILFLLVMVDPPSDLVLTSITSGGELPHNCDFHDARRPCSCEDNLL